MIAVLTKAFQHNVFKFSWNNNSNDFQPSSNCQELRPVTIQEREGAQLSLEYHALVKSKPCSATLSNAGVFNPRAAIKRPMCFKGGIVGIQKRML